MSNNNETYNKIKQVALECFLTQGIKKTTADDVAKQAGVTRVTVYRHFDNKQNLVKAAFFHIITIFQTVKETPEQTPTVDVEAILDSIGQGLAELPRGDLPARLDELRRLYPAIFAEFHETRTAVVKEIFDNLFEVSRQKKLLREELDPNIIQLFFIEAVINFVENPRLMALHLSPSDIYSHVKAIFLHGILKESTQSIFGEVP